MRRIIENSQAFGLTTGTKFGKNWGPDISLIYTGEVSFGVSLLTVSLSTVNSLFFCNTHLKYKAMSLLVSLKSLLTIEICCHLVKDSLILSIERSVTR